MFWHLTVPISQKMYQSSSPIMLISRYLGCFPVTVGKFKTELFLKWSPIHALYSLVFGIIMITLTYDGFVTDVLIGREKSIRNKSQTEMFVTFLDIFVVTSAVFCGIFIAPFKFATFCKYINCFNEIDSKIPPMNTKYSGYFPAFVTFLVLFLSIIVQIADTVMYIRNNANESSLYFFIRCYTAYYICNHSMLLNSCLFWFLVYAILKRIKSLNNYLKVENYITPEVKEITVAPVINNQEGNSRSTELVNKDGNVRDDGNIEMLIVVYGRLCDAVDLLNNLLGINCVIMLTGSLFHLIITFYALIVEILGSKNDSFYIIMMLAWTGIHMARLLFITEPCYRCLIQVQKTKDLVGVLLASAEIDQQYKSQLRDFALILQLRSFQFTASGLVPIDRMLITSILGAITTYLVIVIQFTLTTYQ